MDDTYRIGSCKKNKKTKKHGNYYDMPAMIPQSKINKKTTC